MIFFGGVSSSLVSDFKNGSEKKWFVLRESAARLIQDARDLTWSQISWAGHD